MTEQDLGRDPVTGKKIKRPPSGDAAQNLHHTPAIHPLESARDYSKPHTIPKEEWEETSEMSHEDAIAAWRANEDKRKADARAAEESEE